MNWNLIQKESMKTRLYLIIPVAFLLIAGISCTKEENNPDPTIEIKAGEFKPGVEYVSMDTSLFVNSEFAFGILAQSTSSKNLTNVKLVRKVDNGTPVTVIDSSTSSQTLDLTWIINASPNQDFYEEFTCEVSDANGMTNSVNITIFTLPTDPGIIVYSNKVLASFQLEFDHFMSISNGATYDTSDCLSGSVQALVDIAYFDHVTYGHTLMSPDEDFLFSVYPSVAFWTNKNKTKFSYTEITSGAFDAIETITDFSNAIDNAVTDFDLDFTGDNEEGDVVAFMTNDGTVGLLKVKTTQSSANYGESTIIFDVKIEKNE